MRYDAEKALKKTREVQCPQIKHLKGCYHTAVAEFNSDSGKPWGSRTKIFTNLITDWKSLLIPRSRYPLGTQRFPAQNHVVSKDKRN